jgi:long-chain fatty acid transport protein
MKSRRLRMLTAAGFGSLIAGNAMAAGFMLRENSATGLAMVSAGNGSRAQSAATVFDNPAGMMRLNGTEVEAGTAAVFPSIKFDGSTSVLGSPVPGTNGDNGGMSALIPHMYAATDVMPNVKVGLAITAPFGMTMNYDDNWYGRYVGIKTSALALDINPNVAYRVSNQLSVAAGVSLQYLRFDLSSAIPQFVIFGPTAQDGRYNLKADSWDFGWNVAALFEMSPTTRIGLTYRSKVEHGLEGNLDFANVSPFLGLTSGAATADATMPATATFSFTHDVMPNLSFSADVQWNQWSVFDTVTVQSANGPFPFYEKYEDSWMVSAGAQYGLGNGWTLRGGVGWDGTPVTDEYRTVGVPDTDRYMVGAGAGFELNASTSIDVAYAHYFSAEHASMNNSANNTDPFTHVVVLNGRYTNDLDYVAFSVRYRR